MSTIQPENVQPPIDHAMSSVLEGVLSNLRGITKGIVSLDCPDDNDPSQATLHIVPGSEKPGNYALALGAYNIIRLRALQNQPGAGRNFPPAPSVHLEGVTVLSFPTAKIVVEGLGKIVPNLKPESPIHDQAKDLHDELELYTDLAKALMP